MKKLRFLSIVLVLSMLFSFSAYAISPEEASQAVSADLTPADTQEQGLTKENIDNVTLGVEELTLEQLGLLSVEDTELHEKIDIDTAKQKGHVNRLYEQENDLHTIIYQNKDGSKTSYIFANPVKYVDSEGNVRDKSTKITASSDSKYLYAMEDNNVKAYFSKTVNDGIALTAAGYKIAMKPKGTALGGAATYASDSNSVSYLSPFGNGTSLIYRTTFSGIKEDIVLSSYTGANTFEFELGVTGLTPQKTNGVWTLVNDKDEVIATFSEIITKDANGKMIVGTLDITATNGGYKMTVTVPEAYLTSPGTVYPVYIDPTINFEEDILETYTGVYNEFSGQPSIIDVNMYSTSHEDTVNTYGMNELGGTNPEGRLIIKLPSFYQDKGDGYIDLNQYQIGSVTLSMYAYATAGTVITSKPMGTTWDTATYGEDPVYLGCISSVWNGYGIEGDGPIISTTLNGTGRANFDITEYVQKWAYYNIEGDNFDYWNPANGIMFFSSAACSFDSTDCSDFNNDIYVTIDYSYVGEEYYVYNNTHYKLMANNNGTLGTTTTTGTTATKWRIQYLGDNKHTICSAATNKLLGVSGNSLTFASYSAKTEPANQWTIALLTGSQGYTFTNVSTGQTLYYNGSSFGVSTETDNNTWGMLPYDDYVAMTNFSINDDWIEEDTSKIFKITTTPSNASWYEENMFDWSVTTGSISISSVTNQSATLTSDGSGVVTLTVTHKLTGLSKTFRLTTNVIREGEYMLLNAGSIFSATIENASTTSGAKATAELCKNDDSYKWVFTALDDGGFKIKAKHSNKYLTVDGTSVIQSSGTSITSEKTWIVTKTSNGYYRISPQSNEQLVMCGAGGNLSLMTYNSSNSGNIDKWKPMRIENVLDIENEGQNSEDLSWVVSARMFSRHYYSSITATAEDIVSELNVSGEGTLQNTVDAIDCFADTVSRSINVRSVSDRIYSEDALIRFIDSDHPIIVSLGCYTNNNDTSSISGNQMSVVVGYAYFNDICYFMINDPIANYSYFISYNDLVCDVISIDANTNLYFIWNGAIVYNTNYSSNTVSYYFNQ